MNAIHFVYSRPRVHIDCYCTCVITVVVILYTRAVLRLVWPSILLQSARGRVATYAKSVAASRLWCAMPVKQRKQVSNVLKI